MNHIYLIMPIDFTLRSFSKDAWALTKRRKKSKTKLLAIFDTCEFAGDFIYGLKNADATAKQMSLSSVLSCV